MQIFIDDIEVKVEKKKIKNMHLYIKPPYGEVLCTAPKFASNKSIESFIRSNSEFIISRVNKFRNAEIPLCPQYVSGEKIAIWGDKYTLSCREGKSFNLELLDDVAIFTDKPSSTLEQREKFFLEWYRSELKERVDLLLPKWEEYSNLKCSSWQSKNMKTRWGTCNTKTNKIWLNVQLAKYPVECLEYVILHELAHTKVANHGPEFKAILNEFMPEWKTYRNRLKQL